MEWVSVVFVVAISIAVSVLILRDPIKLALESNGSSAVTFLCPATGDPIDKPIGEWEPYNIGEGRVGFECNHCGKVHVWLVDVAHSPMYVGDAIRFVVTSDGLDTEKPTQD